MTEPKIHSNIVFSQDIVKELQIVLDKYPSGKLFLLTEENTAKHCLPLIQRVVDAYRIKYLTIEAGEANKNIGSVEKVWQFLSTNGADRKSLLVNLGGGMLTDLGGFAASTFKRGMDFVNIPTTLLAQVDASLGGKTGFNFNGFKNEIGVFQEPVTVLVNTNFLKTIDRRNFISGYAEMLKHGLIKSEDHWKELQIYDLKRFDYEALQEMIARSVAIKEWFVKNDPTEKNIRKALNLGHTAGHAFESFAMKAKSPILHGYAVMYGLMVELFLSVKKCGFDPEDMQTIVRWLTSIYGTYTITESDYTALYKLMTHDKKNEAGRINFTLVPKIGEFAIDQHCTKEEVFEALDYYRSLN